MKIKEIKIINQDESTEVASIGADAVNVDYNNTTVKAELDKLNNNNDIISTEQARQETVINNLASEISGLASGNPLPASSISEMTDTTKVYVNITDGHWYAYNGTNWIDGGIYQATEIADGSITAEKTNFLEILNINKASFSSDTVSYNGVVSTRDPEKGIQIYNGTCNANTSYSFFTTDDYLEPETYTIDVNIISGNVSNNIGLTVYGINKNNQSVILINIGVEAGAQTFTINEPMIIRATFWIVNGREFNNFTIFPQLQKGTKISNYIPHRFYKFKNNTNILYIDDNTITTKKTTFIEENHLNNFNPNNNTTSMGVSLTNEEEIGVIKLNGTCTNNVSFKIGKENDYYLEPGTYVFDLQKISGSMSQNVGVTIYGKNLNNESVTLLNIGSEKLPATITISEKIKITSYNLWIVATREFNNLKLFPQLQRGTTIYNNYPFILYSLKNSYLEACVPNLIDENINSKNNLSLLTTNKLYYLPDKELSIYYDNIIFNGDDKEIYNHQSYNNFTHYDNCYRFKKDSINTFYEKIILNKADLIHTQISKNINIIGVDQNAGNGVTKKCLFIGDSLTNLGYYTQELLNLFDNDVMSIELLGTQGSGLNKHEGRSSWSAYSYTHLETYAGLTNPFYNTTTNAFDFSKYMNDNNYSTVDIVSIFLGTNDRGVVGSSSDEIKENLTTMINSIKAFDNNIKILLITPPPICKVGYDYINWNNSIKVADDTIIKNFDGKENQNIFVVPAHFNVDPINDYSMKTIPLNSRSNTNKTVVNDPVHPLVIGFEHIADVIYPYLKYLGSL